jgi:hypothetical protein
MNGSFKEYSGDGIQEVDGMESGYVTSGVNDLVPLSGVSCVLLDCIVDRARTLQ